MIFLWFGLGVIAGGVTTAIICRIRSRRGVLRIDRTDQNKEIYRFDVGDLETLSKRKRLILRIDNHADLSQK